MLNGLDRISFGVSPHCRWREDVYVEKASLLARLLRYLYSNVLLYDTILIFCRLYLLEEKGILLVKLCYGLPSWESKKMVWLNSCFVVCQCVTPLRINGNLLKTLSCVGALLL